MKDKNLDLKDAADCSVSETVVDSAKNTPLNTLDGPLDKESDLTIKESLTKYGDLEVFFSKDPKYLEQYYKLRYEAYRNENGWKEFNTMESRFDRAGKILIVTKNDEFVGGMRLMFSDQCKFMSHELPGTQYDYKKFISKYDSRENLIFSEIAAVVVRKENRGSEVTEAMLCFSLKQSEIHGCSYSFAVAVLIASRHYRKILANLKYDLEIVMNFPWDRKKTYGNFATLIYSKLD